MRFGPQALAFATLVAACIHAPIPAPEERTAVVGRLREAIPQLEDFRVRSFHDLDWCKGLHYERGAFTTILDDSGCLFDEDRAEFDDQAWDDFAEVRRILGNTGVPVRTMSSWQRGCGTEWQFHVAGGAFDRFSYVYCRNGPLPEEPGDSVIIRVDDDWYFESEDWN